MKIKTFWLAIAAFIMLVNCGNGTEKGSSEINAKITVADSVDATGNYSGIQVLILDFSKGTDQADTLFISKTDTSGFLRGTVKVPSQGLYPLVVSRNGVNLMRSQVLLSANDTLSISGELPGLAGNFKVDSREERAVQIFRRVDTGFSRVLIYLRGGAIADSLVSNEIHKWSDLYWDVYKEYPGTIAASLGAKQSIRILKGFNDDLLLERMNESLTTDQMITNAADFGKKFIAEKQGFDASISFVDSLKSLTKNKDVLQALDKVIIVSYYDSSRVDKSAELLDKFKRQYKNDEIAMEWAGKLDYDLTYLSPGKKMPHFEFVTFDGDSISTESLKGTAYILEISPVTNQMYQTQFDRALVIHQLYQNSGINFYTIPLEKSAITADAFFEERNRPWPVAKPGAFDVKSILDTLNVTIIPTRFLVDEKGIISRKYVAEDFDGVLEGINKIINKKNQEN
tara:strand:+ start:78493 stop:79857 length:1365 start_codon:yes stop_codon:yes gene_type:complete